MPRPRKELVSLDATPYYHCTSRCVRRAYLCGNDPVSGQCYEHRRQFIEDKLLFLGSVFAIDVCAYAVMSNHYHTVVFVDKEQALGWNLKEVVDRWHKLYKGTLLSQRFAQGQDLSNSEFEALTQLAEGWRYRLMDISRFFWVLNESIARKANAEDQCRGRFWEGRFTSQALLDEAALTAAMVYVDLNPIRAKMARTPEQSDHTSIKLRCEKATKSANPDHADQQVERLMPFLGIPRHDTPKGLSLRLSDYLELVEWTGRCIREDKRGAIPVQLSPILERLRIEPRHWLYLSTRFESRFKNLVGSAFHIHQTAKKLGYRRMPGPKRCILLVA